MFKLPTHLALAEGAHVKGIWLAPLQNEMLLGRIRDWAAAASVKPVCIPGYWLDHPEKPVQPDAAPAPNEKVILALHGGAYIAFSASPDSPTSVIARGLLDHCKPLGVQRVLQPEYRLSAGPPRKEAANPFPAALIDALAGYDHLVNVVGFSPENIIVEGDSAGGNLALALTRYLVEYRAELAAHAKQTGTRTLAQPGGLILLSPWADMGASHDLPQPASYFSRTDYIGGRGGADAKYPHRAFTGRIGIAGADTIAYISPASRHPDAERASFVGWPRTFLVAGGAEMLAPCIRTLKERMSADMGEGSGVGQLTYYEAPDGVHDYIPLPWHEPERTETLVAIARWLKDDER